jgi:cyclophilin family peptidyl-prolyl cis-trans isomerase
MITLVPTPALDGNQVAFGRVIEGLDVIDRIAPNITISDEDGKETAIDNSQFCTVLEAKVLRKRDHEYQPNKTQ